MKNVLIACLMLYGHALLSNRIPVITQCDVRLEDRYLVVSYELSDAEDPLLEVRCKVIFGAGPRKNQEADVASIEGDIGWPVAQGLSRSMRIRLTDETDLASPLLIILSAYDRQPFLVEELLQKTDEARIMEDLLSLQGKRNETNDRAFKEKARSRISGILGMKDYMRMNESKVGTLTNINFETTRWGTARPDSMEIIDAHYDSYGQAPGADDNASGVCGVLEAFRVLAPYASKKTIRYILFDLEENGLIGSNLYVNNQLPYADHIDNVINFEMIGYYSDKENSQDLPSGFNILFPEAYAKVIGNKRKGDFINNVGNTASRPLINAFSSAAERFVPELKLINLEVPGNGSVAPDLRRSDHASFWDKGYRALMITDGANFRNKNYHTVRDSAQYLDLNFMSAVIKAAIATLAELAGIEHGTSASITYMPPVSVIDQMRPELIVFQKGNVLCMTGSAATGISHLSMTSVSGCRSGWPIVPGTQEIILPESISSGVYFLEAESAKGKLITRIFVKN